METPVLALTLSSLSSIEKLESYRKENNISDQILFAYSLDNFVEIYAVSIRATKIAISPTGEILARAQYGPILPETEWIKWFDLILENSK